MHAGGAILSWRNLKGPLFLESLPIAQFINAFTFVSVVDTSFVGMAALSNGVSIQDLVLVFLTSLLMALVMSFLLQKGNTSGHWGRNLGRATSIVASSFIDQYYLPGRHRRNLRTAFVVASFAWAQSCLLFNTGLKGQHFSSLASTAIPSVPQNIEELVESSEFLIGVSKIFDGGRIKSLLHLNINDILMSREKSNDTFSVTLKRLADEVKYSPLISHVLAYRMTQEPPSTIDVSDGWNSSLIEVEVPENSHILIGLNDDVMNYAAAVKLLSMKNHRQLVLGSEISALSGSVPILVQSNTFHNVFSNKVYQICSSGLWSYWVQAYKASIILDAVRDSWNFAAEQNRTTSSKGDQYYRAALNGEFNPFQKEDESGRPLPFKYFKPPLVLMGMWLILSIIVFIIEILRRTLCSLSFRNQISGTCCF